MIDHVQNPPPQNMRNSSPFTIASKKASQANAATIKKPAKLFLSGVGFCSCSSQGEGGSQFFASSKCPHLNEVDRVLGMVTHFGESFAQQKGKYRLRCKIAFQKSVERSPWALPHHPYHSGIPSAATHPQANTLNKALEYGPDPSRLFRDSRRGEEGGFYFCSLRKRFC
ncbi:hypothetical protein CDAR_128001 [Caerostris darwini]|uniref:Uncharacterized protein n=1 Tax=Caerostris darwini TaxID=1538125 RepID=A0AAV4P5R0_9ARAC|nr:hypothetical protein CDAR_128001 [Caerostris darwini]